MTEQTTELSAEQTEREALFCHTDLNHPAMKMLFDLAFNDESTDQMD